MHRLAIIPARGGCKRIPRKNIKDFCGKPIIAYSFKAALDSGLFTKVIVSTDDKEVAAIATQYGASVPFYRSVETADDYASLADVVLEVLNKLKSKKLSYDQFACILPTASFISKERLTDGFALIDKEKFSSVFPVLRHFSYPIQRALRVDEFTQRVSMLWPENLQKRTQDLEPYFHDSGQFYCVDTMDFINEKSLLMKNSGVIELKEMEVQDIDTPEDWEIAEFKYKLIKSLV